MSRKSRLRLTSLENRITPATFTVTNTDDSGPGSLRDAIAQANFTSANDVIEFSYLFQNTTQKIMLTSGEIGIDNSLTIVGPGADRLTISGGNASRIFRIDSPQSVEINGLTLTEGFADDGGAIWSNCYLKLNDVVLTQNKATNDGGAIASYGLLDLTRTAVTNNSAAQHGGGVLARDVIMTSSTVSGNTAGIHGGGVNLNETFADPIFTIRNSTLSQNAAPRGAALSLGVGVFTSFNSHVTIRNSTIAKNLAIDGGVIQLTHGAGAIKVESSIVAENQGSLADIASTGAVTVNYSAIGSPVGFLFTGSNNLPLEADIKLGPLADNGGPTQTMSPLFGSPLINAGSNPTPPLDTDQRGRSRTYNGAPDIGAVEINPMIYVVDTATDVNDGNYSKGNLSLREAFHLVDQFPDTPDTITFDANSFNVPTTITLTNGALFARGDITINGPGAQLLTVSGDDKFTVFGFGESIHHQVTMTDLTIAHGKSAGTGGGIWLSNIDFTLQRCVVSDNKAGYAAGIVNMGLGILTVIDSSVINNSASVHFGAIYSGGSLVISRSTIANNAAGQSAGGLYTRTSLAMTDSTVANNSAGYVGGGIALDNPTLISATLVNCTISGNTAVARGGGIVLGYDATYQFNTTLNVRNCTITNNQSAIGGGIAFFTGTGSVLLESSVVSGNSATTSGPDVDSNNLVNITRCALGTLSGLTTYSIDSKSLALLGVPTKLGLLANNGGLTKTHRPASDSPLIDQGANLIGVAMDQRGAPRNRGAGPDIGAFETMPPLVVTNTNDAGAGSLRQAIQDANAEFGVDTITFAADFYYEPRTITLTTGELLITEGVAILGPGSTLLSISGNDASRVFHITAPAGSNVTIDDVTITRGKVFVPGGGGLLIESGSLSMTRCWISENSAHKAGGIGVEGSSSVSLTECTVTNNVSTANIGGIGGSGQVVLWQSTVSGNYAANLAGGVYSSTSLVVFNSSIVYNSAGVSGGGIFSSVKAGKSIVIVNSTISHNSAPDSGGIGLGFGAPHLFEGALYLFTSTVTENKATQTSGGGIRRRAGSGAITLESSIVSGNTAITTGADLYTTGAIDAKTSLIGTIAGVTTLNADAVTTMNLGKAPMLGPLTNNGGTTPTHALLVGSPAINNGSNPLGWLADQTGRPRTVGIGPDIGAFELQPPPRVTSVVIDNGSTQRSQVRSITVDFDGVVNVSAIPGAAFQLVRHSDGAKVDCQILISQTTTTQATLLFTGGAVNGTSLADGRYTLTLLANGLVDPSGQPLDGDGNGVSGGNYQLVGNPTNGLFRLFGDADGNGIVNTSDFATFRAEFGLAGSIFDFNNDGQTNTTDFAQFRARFGVGI